MQASEPAALGSTPTHAGGGCTSAASKALLRACVAPLKQGGAWHAQRRVRGAPAAATHTQLALVVASPSATRNRNSSKTCSVCVLGSRHRQAGLKCRLNLPHAGPVCRATQGEHMQPAREVAGPTRTHQNTCVNGLRHARVPQCTARSGANTAATAAMRSPAAAAFAARNAARPTRQGCGRGRAAAPHAAQPAVLEPAGWLNASLPLSAQEAHADAEKAAELGTRGRHTAPTTACARVHSAPLAVQRLVHACSMLDALYMTRLGKWMCLSTAAMRQ